MKFLIKYIIGITVASSTASGLADDKNSTRPTSKQGGRALVTMTGLKVIEDGLKGLVYDPKNPKRFPVTFRTDKMSFVSRVPANFPGNKEFKGKNLRRLTFSFLEVKGKGNSLILEQSLYDKEVPLIQNVLAKNVDVFFVLYWSTLVTDWIVEWNDFGPPIKAKVYLALTPANGTPALEKDLQNTVVTFKDNTVPNWPETEIAIEKSIRKVLGKPDEPLTITDFRRIKTMTLFLPPNIPLISKHKLITDVSQITQLTKIEELYCFNYTKLDESALTVLKKKLPHCEIIFYPHSHSRGKGNRPSISHASPPSVDEIFKMWSNRVPQKIRDGIDADKDGNISDE